MNRPKLCSKLLMNTSLTTIGDSLCFPALLRDSDSATCKEKWIQGLTSTLFIKGLKVQMETAFKHPDTQLQVIHQLFLA